MMKKIFLCLSFIIACGSIARSQELALSTNFVDYASLGTLNLEASLGLSQHWSINAGVKYNPFSYETGDETFRLKQRQINAGGRYWPWHVYSGWWFSGLIGYQEYNEGGLLSEITSEGDRFGAGLGLGYTYMLNAHLNLDIGAGFWGGYDIYTSYSCAYCGKILDQGGKFFLLPSNILLALTYIF